MAKKKKRIQTGRTESAAVAPQAAILAAGWLWLAAVAGLFGALSFLLVPWVTVLGTTRNGALVLIEAARTGSWTVGFAALLALLPALLAMALPFTRPQSSLRTLAVGATAIGSGVSVLIVTILAKSTRNLLAFGSSGRQIVPQGSPMFLIYLSLLFAMGAAVAWMIRQDDEIAGNRQAVVWFAVFSVLLLGFMIFMYEIIPGSLIPPPEIIRMRMG